jgi:hypothetical protein
MSTYLEARTLAACAAAAQPPAPSRAEHALQKPEASGLASAKRSPAPGGAYATESEYILRKVYLSNLALSACAESLSHILQAVRVYSARLKSLMKARFMPSLSPSALGLKISCQATEHRRYPPCQNIIFTPENLLMTKTGKFSPLNRK